MRNPRIYTESQISNLREECFETLTGADTDIDYDRIIFLMTKHKFLINDCGTEMLEEAAQFDNIKLIKTLIKLGVNIDCHNCKPLKLALMHGNYNAAKYLLKHGANPHGRNNVCFNYAIEDKDPAMLKLLLEYYVKSDNKYEKLLNLANNMKPRIYDDRFAGSHGVRHRIHPYDGTYEPCDYCPHMTEYTMKNYLSNFS